MPTSRDKILNKLRAARRPFADAPPRPRQYAPVTGLDDESPDGLLARFQEVAATIFTEVHVVKGDAAACKQIVAVLRAKHAGRILAWDFEHIPVKGLQKALADAEIDVLRPDIQDEFRMETLDAAGEAGAGLTGVDAVAATTATLIVTSGKGRGRIPTVLPPVHIAIARLDQFVGRIEDWVARQRAEDLQTIRTSANVAFLTGPSATGDIEMLTVRGVHGPGELVVIVKR